MHDLTPKLKEGIETVLTYDRSRLIARPEWGEINLNECEQEIGTIFTLLQDLRSLPVELIPRDATNGIITVLDQLKHILMEIEKFSIKQPDPTGTIQAFTQQIKSIEQQLLTIVAPWLGFLSYKRGDVERKVQEFDRALAGVRDREQEALERSEEVVKQMNELLASARQAAAETGVATFTENFKGEANGYSDAAQKWLRAAVCGAALTVLAAGFLWFWTEPGLDQGQLFQKLSTKLVLLALLFSATLWCGRVYKAMKHLETINRHRAVSIQTLQAFVKAASDEQTRNAVLMEAARAVFGPVPTGFVEQGGSGESEVKVVEWVRGLMQKS